MQSMPMTSPHAAIYQGVDLIELVPIVGQNKEWQLRQDGAILDRTGHLIAPNLMVAANTMAELGWLTANPNTGRWNAIHWGIIPHDGEEAARHLIVAQVVPA